MRWPFSKTYKVRCPDGSIKTVYKNVDDAFPLHIPGWKANLVAAGKVLDKASADMKAEYSTAIHGLLFALDNLNQGLMMTFRGAYVVYQNDPYKHSDFFEREVSKLLDEQRRLRTLKIQIDGLIELAKLQPKQSEEFARALASVVERMGSLMMPQTISERIQQAKQIADQMSEAIHEN
jgi:hypothetical protein